MRRSAQLHEIFLGYYSGYDLKIYELLSSRFQKNFYKKIIKL